MSIDEELSKNITLLDSANPHIRFQAVLTLGEAGDKDAVPLLRRLLKDKSSKVRHAARVSLVEFGDEQTIEYLLNLLSNKTVYHKTRYSIVLAFSRNHIEQASDIFFNIYKDKTDVSLIREAALEGLGKIPYPGLEPHLIESVKDKTEQLEVRNIATELLGELEIQDAFGLLVSVLNDPIEPEELRANAAYALGILDTSAAFEPLIKAMDNKSSDIRYWVVNALGHHGNKDAVPLLHKMLETEKNVDVRASILQALEDLQDPSSVETIVNLLEDRNWLVRWYAIGAVLRSTSDEIAASLIAKRLNDKSLWVKSSAARTLGEIAGQEYLPVLQKVLNNSQVRTKKEQEFVKNLQWTIAKIASKEE